ncbi:unnamed protein product [Camellia sinensis]
MNMDLGIGCACPRDQQHKDAQVGDGFHLTIYITRHRYANNNAVILGYSSSSYWCLMPRIKFFGSHFIYETKETCFFFPFLFVFVCVDDIIFTQIKMMTNYLSFIFSY